MASQRQRIRNERKLANIGQPAPSPTPVPGPEPVAPEPVIESAEGADLQPVTDIPDGTQPPPIQPNDRKKTPLDWLR